MPTVPSMFRKHPPFLFSHTRCPEVNPKLDHLFVDFLLARHIPLRRAWILPCALKQKWFKLTYPFFPFRLMACRGGAAALALAELAIRRAKEESISDDEWATQSRLVG